MTTSKRTLFILLSLTFFLFLVFLVSLIFLLYLFLTPPSTTSSTHSTKTYLYQEVTPSSETEPTSISYGFATLEQDLPKSEFVHYHVDETSNKYVILSHFGGSEYECRGTCSCPSSSDLRRNSATLLTRSLTLLLSALSAPIALKMAEEIFHESCTAQFSETCDEPTSDVEECEKSDEVQSLEILEGSFDCEGSCVLNQEVRSWGKISDHASEFHREQCEGLFLEKEMLIDWKALFVVFDGLGRTTDDVSMSEVMKLAEVQFSDTELRKFCEETSEIWADQLEGLKKGEFGEDEKVSICTGGYPKGEVVYTEKLPEDNVKCIFKKGEPISWKPPGHE